jgi:hypothetical protein
LIIELARLPLTTAGVSSRSLMPARALLLAPDAARSFLTLERESGGLVYTEIYQSLDATLAALERRRETYQPSFSPHGYGLAFDLDVDATLARTRWTYARLLVVPRRAQPGSCFRRDGERGDQDHHLDVPRQVGLADPRHGGPGEPADLAAGGGPPARRAIRGSVPDDARRAAGGSREARSLSRRGRRQLGFSMSRDTRRLLFERQFLSRGIAGINESWPSLRPKLE